MPELPEVETIRRDLEPLLVGRTITRAKIHPGAERLAVTHSPRALERALTGRRIVAMDRQGKYLLTRLDDGRTWVMHLRMTGSPVYVPPPDGKKAAHRFERARMDFDDGSSLRLNDMRKFATWHLVEDAHEAMPRTGPDALSEEFSVARLRAAMARRTAPVKGVLLDQSVGAGIGNIYADEACWIAAVDPRMPANELSGRRVTRLHAAVRKTLSDSLDHRGSSFSDYRDGLGSEGMHHVHVHVFRRNGQPCERCGHEITKIRLVGRGTHLCTFCQRGG